MASPRWHIGVMTRFPVPGSSKTRLIPSLGARAAAELQREMTAHVVRQSLILAATSPCSVQALVTGGSRRETKRWLGIDTAEQTAGDLGERIENALAEGLRRAHVAAVVGADCPTVDAADMRVTLTAAEQCGAAFVPATDGGYCMLAVSRELAGRLGGLFEGCAWGTETVLAESLACLRAVGVEPVLTEPRQDVDLVADLPAWEAVRRAWHEPPRTLAVVIPTLNEAERLPALLRSLAAGSDGGLRVYVADGGSTDATAELAAREGAQVVTGARGRGAQLNAGAMAALEAGADALLFLHADCILPRSYATAALDTLADPDVALGAFTFSTGGATPTMRLLERNTNRRARLAGMPYGDQGLFCRSAMWRALGGFPEFPVMEDYEFVRRARRVGRVAIRPEPLVTSDRAWRTFGPWRWTLLNMATVARYHLGDTPEQLAEWRRAQSKR